MAECVKVVVRCRPMNSRELAMKCCSVVDIDSTSRECSLTVDEKSPRKRFTFDGAYDAQNNTEQIYSRVIYPLVEVRGGSGSVLLFSLILFKAFVRLFSATVRLFSAIVRFLRSFKCFLLKCMSFFGFLFKKCGCFCRDFCRK